jgi:hypothetical protein
MNNLELYRYETMQWAAPLDWEGYPSGRGRVEVVLKTFDILRITKCGSWIEYQGRKKFVNHNARKQFANKTKEEAKTAFIARKKSQLRILQHQIDVIEQSLDLMQPEQDIFKAIAQSSSY